MAERRMAEVMGERAGLGEILVEAERARQRARDLGDLQGVGEPRAIVVALVVDEHLRLVGEPAEGGGMDDAIAIAAEIAARGAGRLGMEPAPARRGIGGIGRARAAAAYRHGITPLAVDLVWHRT